MAEKELEAFFDESIGKDSLFFDKSMLQSGYTPETILHREDQTKQIANILSSSLKGDKPSNLFVYGKTGTGKTLTIKYTTKKLMEVAEKKEIPLKVLYVNCKLKRSADTE